VLHRVREYLPEPYELQYKSTGPVLNVIIYSSLEDAIRIEQNSFTSCGDEFRTERVGGVQGVDAEIRNDARGCRNRSGRLLSKKTDGRNCEEKYEEFSQQGCSLGYHSFGNHEIVSLLH